MAVHDSSVVSTFKFHSYKIDEFRFSIEKKIELLAFQGCYNQDSWDPEISIRQPTYFEGFKYYLSGVGCKLSLRPNKIAGAPILAVAEASISGIFSTENRFTPDDEEALVKYQMPAILFPYLRSTITSFFANAGFGSFIFPLINMQEVARQTLKDMKPLIVKSK